MEDAKVYAVIRDMTRNELIDAIDNALGVGCLDERDTDSLRDEVRSLYQDGKIAGAEIIAAYDGGL